MAAIKDVAKKTGLSIATISNFMNGKKVREENRILIEQAIKEMGYRPNEFARGLRTAKSYIIGVLIFRLQDVFSAKVVGTLERYLSEQGYSMILWSHEGDREQAREALEFMMRNQAEGIIVEPIPGEEHLYDEIYGKIPIVAVDRIIDMKKYDSVMSNSMLGVYEGTEYLIEKGHRKIAMLAAGKYDTKGMTSGIERLKGFQRAMEDYELQIPEEWIVEGDFTFQSGYEGMKKLWEQTERPTAVIAANYNMCMGMMKAVHELGIQVPEELSVLSMDDMIFTEICYPTITAIRQPTEEIAKKTVEIILKRICGDYSDFPKTWKIHTTFVERESVKELFHT